MIFIPIFDKKFPLKETELLYEENRKYLTQNQHLSFQELCEQSNGNLWAVIENELIGVIYFGFKDGKWYLSGFSHRKMFKHITNAINGLCDIYFEHWNITEIWSETIHKHSKFALLRAGFKEITQNLYRRLK